MRNSPTLPDVSAVRLSNLIGDQEIQIILIVNVCTVLGLINLFGAICNIINIIIFVKQGIKDTTNISLLGIAVADTGAHVTYLWGSICLNPLMIQKFEDMEMMEIQYLTSSCPHFYFVLVTGWLTALVTIERYLCIAYPLKVQSLVTPQRTVVINVTVFVIVTADTIPTSILTSLGRKFSFGKNRSVIGIVYSPDYYTIQGIFSNFDVILKLASYITVAFMTILLVQKLSHTAKWRNSSMTASKSETISARDKRVVMMVIFTSVIFILCFFPVVVFFVAMKVVKQFRVIGSDKNLFFANGSCLALFEAVSSTANMFVYFRMSSKYRETFESLFSWTLSKS